MNNRFLISLIVFVVASLGLLSILSEPIASTRMSYFAASQENQTAVQLSAGQSATDPTYRVTIDGSSIQQIARVYLRFGTHGKPMPIRSLVVTSGSCGFTYAGDKLYDNELVEVAGAACETGGEPLLVEVVSEEPQSLAIWAYEANIEDAAIVGTGFSPQGGWKPREVQSDTTRVGALSKIWFDSEESLWLSLLIFTLFVVGMLCALLLVFGSFKRDWSSPLLIAGAFACLGGLYTSLTLPYHAPDEPDHLLRLARVSNLKHVAKGAVVLAQETHYPRMACNKSEKLSASDLGQRQMEGWPPHVTERMWKSRSAVGDSMWRTLSPILRMKTSRVLLTTRFTNILFASIGVFFVAYLQQKYRREIGLWPWLFVFVIPTIPYFTMMVSNYVFLITAFIAGLGALCCFGRQSNIAILTAILSGLLAMLAGRGGIAWAIIAFGGAGVHLVVTAVGAQKNTYRNTVQVFVLSYLVGLFLFLLYGSSPYVEDLNRSGIGIPLISAVFALAAVLLIGVRTYRIQLMSLASQIDQKFRRPLLYGFIACIVVLSILPLVAKVPNLTNIEHLTVHRPSSTYLVEVLRVFLGQIGIGGNDFYLIWSFFGGFGCPETVLSQRFVGLLKLVVWAGFGMFLLGILKRRFSLGSALIGALLTIIYLGGLAVAAAGLTSPFNLHGRYLVGFYLLFFVPAGLGWGYFIDRRAGANAKWYSSLLGLIAIVSIHLTAFASLMTRYFG